MIYIYIFSDFQSNSNIAYHKPLEYSMFKDFIKKGRATWIQIYCFYYIDRCYLWVFTREINSGISHARYQCFPAVTTFTQL